ncbi:hypothetical protein L596_016253 [Steinernema carpocapsae]|uniref:Uncharacterized protein n=1 Tax=Steinernema carpocapsae TaxID=34508 RepID=A0A4U5NI22_STECR|nr:hypothetical protein L596_016253 [Steinernema carpocapsae]
MRSQTLNRKLYNFITKLKIRPLAFVALLPVFALDYKPDPEITKIDVRQFKIWLFCKPANHPTVPKTLTTMYNNTQKSIDVTKPQKTKRKKPPQKPVECKQFA